MATLNGIDLFHLCIVRTVPLPVRQQITRYPGVYGTQRKRLGGSGFVTTIEGELVATSIADLNLAETLLRNYMQDSGSYVFVDNYLNVWPQVYLENVAWLDRVEACEGIWPYVRRYQALLNHLI